MNIVNANTLKAKDVILSLIDKIDKKDNTTEAINAWLTVSLGTDIFGAWLAFDKDEPIGLICGEIVDLEKDPKVYIAFEYAKPGLSLLKDLLAHVENWAKEKNIKRLLYYSKKNPHTWIKKHGFRLVQSILDKEL